MSGQFHQSFQQTAAQMMKVCLPLALFAAASSSMIATTEAMSPSSKTVVSPQDAANWSFAGHCAGIGVQADEVTFRTIHERTDFDSDTSPQCLHRRGAAVLESR